MKITAVQIFKGDVVGRRPCFVKVMTDEGIHGVGEAALAYGIGATAAAGMVQDLANAFLLGKDPSRIESLWSEMYDHTFWAKGGGPVIFAGMSAIEQALWDIKGKVLGVPIYELLGGSCRSDVKVYANGWAYHHNTPADQARAAEQVVADGYTAIKMYPLATPTSDNVKGTLKHVSRREFDREAENLAVARVREVRGAIGPDIELMIDLSCELTTDAVIHLIRRIEEYDLLFIEEPVDPFDVEALKKVSDHVNLPIAVGERLYTRYGFRRVFEMHAADIVQPSLGTCGGIMEAKKIAAMAETYNMRMAPHNCAGPVSTAASLQLDACIPNFFMQEVFPYRNPEHYIVAEPASELEIKNGRLKISDRPGLGIDLVEKNVLPLLWAECKA